MNKIGVFPGKFLPPHRGHLTAILRAHALCDKLYVVVCDRKEYDSLIIDGKTIPAKLRKMWFMKEFQNLEGIEVVIADENTIPTDPDGWPYWYDLLKRTVPEPFHVIFGNEMSYKDFHDKYIPKEIGYEIVDYSRSVWNISGTSIRDNIFQHWDYLLGASRPYFAKRVLITGSESCVDSETEYFNGLDWVKISKYSGGRVLQYNSDGTSDMVIPYRYINLPLKEGETFYSMQNTYGTWKQVYTLDHDLVYLTSKGNLGKIPFSEVLKRHQKNEYGFYGSFLASFSHRGDYEIDENRLRLAVAISADGSKARQKWRIRLIKERKIERMRDLIKKCGLPLDERVYADGSHNFYTPLEYGVKVFPQEWRTLSISLKEAFRDEIYRWDGSIISGNQYFSTELENAKTVQFIIASLGIKTMWNEDIREGRSICYRVSEGKTKYLSISVNDLTRDRKKDLVKKHDDHNGRKYCFTVPSGMLVLRRDNHIFITGNCGKSTLTQKLAKIFYTSWSEEVGRYYSERFLGKDETAFSVKDFERIAYLQHENDLDALNKANKVCFFDTDAIVTQFFSKVYLGEESPGVNAFIDPDKYDLVIMLTPEVKWVGDGLRFLGEEATRWNAFTELDDRYRRAGFEDKMIHISGDNYHNRLTQCIEAVNELIK